MTQKHQNLTFLSVFLASTITLSSSVQSEEMPSIKSLMTAEELKSTGVKTLNSEQLKALNKWLVRYTAQDSAIVRQTYESVKKQVATEIRSEIVGSFKGWKGKTKFTLKNGQVWQQRNQKSDTRWSKNLNNPEVLIKRNFLGLYVLEIVSEGKTTKVKRIK